MTPMRRAYLDELKTILLEGRHPDGRKLGRALAHRLADAFGVARPLYPGGTP